MHEGAELDVENQGASFSVVDELIFKAKPDGARRVLGFGGDLDEVGGDAAVEPGAHGAVHALPMGINDDLRADVFHDVVGKLVLVGVVEEGLPSSVVRRNVVEDDRYESLDIEDGDGLGMEGDNHNL